MKIALITYAIPHQKTQDVLSGLLLKGYKNIHLFAIPFSQRKTRPVGYIHRFNNPLDIHPKQLAQNLTLDYTESTPAELNTHFNKMSFDKILIAGAGLLPEELATNHKIINGHPGYLPKVKGLDALKWAILNDTEELGVTTHYISEKADEGILIDRKIIPLYKEDSFQSFALRQYQTEIEMLINSVEQTNKITEQTNLSDDSYSATMRMPIRLEEEMITKFEKRKSSSPSIWTL